MLNKLSKSLINIIAIISTIILFVIFVSNMVLTCTVGYSWRENTVYNLTYWWILLLPVVLALFYFIYLRLDKISTKSILIIGFSVYIIFGTYILLNTKEFIKADALTCLECAKRLLDNDVSIFNKGSYVLMFPYQLGFIGYDMIVLSLFNNVNVLYVLNLIYILIIDYFIYKISYKLFNDGKISKMTLIVAFLFLPLFFYFLFGYGTIPGLCTITIAIYCFINYLNDNKTISIVLTILFCVLACILKQNYKIAAMAMFIVIVIRCLQTKINLKNTVLPLAFAFLILISSLFANSFVTSLFEYKYNVEIGSGVPTITYIAMGTDLNNNNMRAPGWFDGSPNYDADDFNHNYVAMKEYENEKLSNNIKDTLKSPFKSFSFYTRKISSMWSEPLFQSIWSGPINSEDEVYVNGKILESLYSGGVANKILILFCKCMLVIIIFTSLLFSRKHLNNINYLFFYLYFIGGFVFHLFSEGKSQYTFMYIVMLIPFVGYELIKIFNYIIKQRTKI